MDAIEVTLNEKNSQRASHLSHSTAMTRDQLVNEAFDRFFADLEKDEQRKFIAWQEAAKQIAGMWKDRRRLKGRHALL